MDDCCIDLDSDTSLDHARVHHDFSLRHLVWGVQNGADVKTVARYINRFSSSRMEEELGKDLAVAPGGPFFPVLYFAVERNSPAIVRLLCNAGAQPSQRMRPLGLAIIRLPILAYSILSAEYDLSDTTDTLVTLLAMGANPCDIPSDMWGRYLVAPTKDNPGHQDSGASNDLWCTPELREALCRNLNLMQRYALWKADSAKQKTSRMREVAIHLSIEPLFETIFHIIGQRSATEQVIHSITDHRMFGDTAPLILLLTGPSGHGKTELARQMGDLLSLEMHTVDCTEMKHETDMFGPKAPYHGYEKGAPLNNFLGEKVGERCVIFLDEVEKATVEIRNAMLKLFEQGFYRDRRFSKRIDCSKVIWVLASNLGCEIIQKFWAERSKDLPEERQEEVSFTSLERCLKQSIINNLGAPFTGRLTSIIPFMPFSLEEQAVATYKFMRNLWTEVRKPIDVASKRFPRHLFVNYNDDGAIAAHIAKGNYSTETGARSLERAVNREIRGRLSRVFLSGNEMVKDEMNNGPLQNYEVRLVSSEEDVDEVCVEQRGTRQTLKPAEKHVCSASAN